MGEDNRPGVTVVARSCPTAAEVDEYFASRVDRAGRAAMERHIASCGACRQLLAGLARCGVNQAARHR